MADFIFNFNNDQTIALSSIRTNPTRNSDFRTWTIITVILPFLTFAITVLFNMILSPSICSILNNWPKFLLNGSLPIICFGIISSGVSYLMEDLDINNPTVQTIRRRVMAIAIIFLFLTSVLYIFQSVTSVSENLKTVQNILILIITLIVCVFSISIGLKMYLLQNSMVSDISESMNNNVGNINNELNDLYGEGQ